MSPVLRTALFGTAVGLALMAGPALAATIKVGVIAPFSGPFATAGQTFKQAIEVYQAQHGKTVGGDTIEFVFKDLDQANPAQSKALAQELIVKEKVGYLAGFFFTPDALAVAPLIDEAKIPCVIFNAATSAITEKSPLYVRTSFTLWQASVPLADYVHKQGVKKVITAVSDYGPGIDGETAFKTTFEKAGGQVVDTIRMPLKSTDFAPFMQRIKDSGAEAIYAFLPAGPTTLAFAKAFNDTGLKAAGIKFFGPGDITQEPDLPALGDAALGIVTSFHYSQAHDSAMNKAFVAKHKELFGSTQTVTFTSVGAYDGTHLIYKMVEATGGKSDGAKAVDAIKNLSWESPRGPLKLDPASRTVIQTMYIRETVRGADGLINKEIAAIPDQPDYGYKGGK
ncbi:ABC transporter substrate-binding protein [Azospirillum sp. RWY-5-1]|uniref:ABC transporter substrate-binding protein n=1 Tax=Azospirillum oleiclasticum TaxID=2735135 RepID=A0ABX2T7K9_9PROT|nr:ABC transporter substrate-binding protein [Azospirillum oleiclasticum]NYZ12620.1 ABC transporter substrate-binding protein [Azospirillum oleiclasticum]NYZ19780.1 ABC transporter substrate-binding protein [Azospirillum oleiclasticum]